ncbi:MAG: hypothetical protein Q9211_001612 [Gyalolechia sp. 1 TL-2023]
MSRDIFESQREDDGGAAFPWLAQSGCHLRQAGPLSDGLDGVHEASNQLYEYYFYYGESRRLLVESGRTSIDALVQCLFPPGLYLNKHSHRRRGHGQQLTVTIANPEISTVLLVSVPKVGSSGLALTSGGAAGHINEPELRSNQRSGSPSKRAGLLHPSRARPWILEGLGAINFRNNGWDMQENVGTASWSTVTSALSKYCFVGNESNEPRNAFNDPIISTRKQEARSSCPPSVVDSSEIRNQQVRESE